MTNNEDQVGAAIALHGQPVRVQTGVAFDEDGWQATALWHFADGTKMQQYLVPSPTQEHAERDAAKWADAIRKVFRAID